MNTIIILFFPNFQVHELREKQYKIFVVKKKKVVNTHYCEGDWLTYFGEVITSFDYVYPFWK